MDKTTYQNYIKSITIKPNKLKNGLIAFISGGTLSLVSTIAYEILNNYYSDTKSLQIVILSIIILTSFLTCIGVCDTLFSKLKSGLIIPISGFAHSISSCVIDYKKEGFIAIGSNTFKLAGSVILYGITSSIIFVLIKVIIIDNI